MRALICVRIEFAVLDTGARTHALHFSGNDIANVPERVFVRHRAFEHIGHDFHVFVAVCAKALAGRDVVIIDHAQRPEMHVLRILIFGKRKAEPALQPAVIGLAAVFGFSERQHDACLCAECLCLRDKLWALQKA